jgi:hypothetical protein
MNNFDRIFRRLAESERKSSSICLHPPNARLDVAVPRFSRITDHKPPSRRANRDTAISIGATDNPTRIVILSDQRESKDLPCQANRRLGSLPQSSKFLIANPGLKFLVSHGRSIGCNFLIANKSRFLVTEFAPPPTCGSDFPTEQRLAYSNQLKLSRYYVMVTLTFSRVR